METRQYKGQHELEKGNKEMAKKGYKIVSVTEVKQPVGLGRVALIGVGALVVKPKPHYYVTYDL